MLTESHSLISRDDFSKRGIDLVVREAEQSHNRWEVLGDVVEVALDMLHENKQEKQKKQQKVRIEGRSNWCEHISEMPERMRDVIRGLNGERVMLVIQKRLYYTDWREHHHRMSIPVNQMRGEFLTEDEKRILEGKGKGSRMMVMFVEPCLDVWEIGFKRWKMGKGDGKKVSYSYVLQKNWNDVKKKNGLRPGDLVQLWSFRRNQELCLALSLVTKGFVD